MQIVHSATSSLLGVTLLQGTMIWQLIVIAGIIGGLLARNYKTAVLSGILGFLASWLLFFGLLGVGTPVSFGLAFSFFSLFFAIGMVLVMLLGFASASMGYLMRVIDEARSNKKKK